jgi:AcrR family transcriptional regulator
MSSQNLRNMIIDTYREMASVLGIRRITIDMLAKRCGISKKTFYKYFATKDDLVRFVSDDSLSTMRAQFAEIGKSDKSPMQKLVELIAITYTSFGSASRPLLEDIRTSYPEIYDKAMRFKEDQASIILGIVKSGIETGIFRNFNPALVLNAFLGASDRVLNPDFILENNMTIEEVMKSFYELSLYGLINPERMPRQGSDRTTSGG